MQTSFNRNTCFAAVAAAAIVGFTGLVVERSLDQTYDSALPVGTVEICEIPPLAACGHAAAHFEAQS